MMQSLNRAGLTTIGATGCEGRRRRAISRQRERHLPAVARPGTDDGPRLLHGGRGDGQHRRAGDAEPAEDRRDQAVPGRRMAGRHRLRRAGVRPGQRQHAAPEGDREAGGLRAVGPHRARDREGRAAAPRAHHARGDRRRLPGADREDQQGVPDPHAALDDVSLGPADAGAHRADEEAGDVRRRAHAAADDRRHLPEDPRRPRLRQPAAPVGAEQRHHVGRRHRLQPRAPTTRSSHSAIS